jgi:hypothetical protein
MSIYVPAGLADAPVNAQATCLGPTRLTVP